MTRSGGPSASTPLPKGTLFLSAFVPALDTVIRQVQRAMDPDAQSPQRTADATFAVLAAFQQWQFAEYITQDIARTLDRSHKAIATAGLRKFERRVGGGERLNRLRDVIVHPYDYAIQQGDHQAGKPAAEFATFSSFRSSNKMPGLMALGGPITRPSVRLSITISGDQPEVVDMADLGDAAYDLFLSIFRALSP